MDFQALYAILAAVARRRGQITYTELSEAYGGATGDWIEPHGGWDDPLGDLNQRLTAAGRPAMSAVVVLNDTREPGGGFWESCASVPRRPSNNLNRIAEYGRILGGVHDADWPETLPRPI